jgi:hypothetical protein
MPTAISTPGEIRKGKLRVKDADRFSAALARFRDGAVEITVERKYATRSMAQNAWYWSCVVGLVAEHTGYTPDEIHEIYKAKFIPKPMAIADGNGEIVGEVVLGGSTTRMDTVQFSDYCERIREWAATLGVVIPDPPEKA